MKVIRWMRRNIGRFLILIVLAVLFAVGTSEWVRIKARPHLMDIEQAEEQVEKQGLYDCILVLGCGVYSDGTLTPMLRDRLQRAFELYQAGVAPKILVSGDHGTTEYDEVNHMKQALMEWGVPSQDIFMDHAGFSTYESMYRAKNIFQISRCVIVTQEYHLFRAVYTARRLEIQADGIAAQKIKYRGWISRSIREILARDKDFLYCIVKPEAKIMGDVIPLTGSGDVTNDK